MEFTLALLKMFILIKTKCYRSYCFQRVHQSEIKRKLEEFAQRERIYKIKVIFIST